MRLFKSFKCVQFPTYRYEPRGHTVNLIHTLNDDDF